MNLQRRTPTCGVTQNACGAGSLEPAGYHWVQTCDDCVLAAITTGVILQLLLRN